MRNLKWIAALGLVSLCAGTAAHADNTGIYAGGSVGQAKTDFSDDTLDDLFDGKDTAFKLFLGYRVLDWVGFEAEYVDLGEITLRGGQQPGVSGFRLEEAGFGAFGLLYWTPAPQLDLFAKAGFVVSQAHVRTNTFFGSFDDTDNSTDLSWGIGAQVRFDKLAIRAEYQRFEIDVADGFDPPDMISVGASWTFF
jgi:opacity protein-like surface antigen